jgi:hypothetical protein
MNNSFDDLQCEDVYGNNEDAMEFAALCELERQEIWQTVDDTEQLWGEFWQEIRDSAK